MSIETRKMATISVYGTNWWNLLSYEQMKEMADTYYPGTSIDDILTTHIVSMWRMEQKKSSASAPSTQLDTEEGFTKGDWRVTHEGAELDKEAEANAHLISAAPDMYLDIIKPLLELLNNCSSSITIKKNSLFEKDLNRIAKKANPKL